LLPTKQRLQCFLQIRPSRRRFKNDRIRLVGTGKASWAAIHSRAAAPWHLAQSHASSRYLVLGARPSRRACRFGWCLIRTRFSVEAVLPESAHRPPLSQRQTKGDCAIPDAVPKKVAGFRSRGSAQRKADSGYDGIPGPLLAFVVINVDTVPGTRRSFWKITATIVDAPATRSRDYGEPVRNSFVVELG
jgi:hypothetical protein